MTISFAVGPPTCHALRLLLAIFGRMRGSLGTPMQLAVRRSEYDLKVLRAVVEPVMVFVVNILTRHQWSAEERFHDDSMLSSISIVPDMKEPVAVLDNESWSPLHAARIMAADEAPWISPYRALSAVGPDRYGGRLTAPALTQGSAGVRGPLYHAARFITGLFCKRHMPRQYNWFAPVGIIGPFNRAPAPACARDSYDVAREIEGGSPSPRVIDWLFTTAGAFKRIHS